MDTFEKIRENFIKEFNLTEDDVAEIILEQGKKKAILKKKYR